MSIWGKQDPKPPGTDGIGSIDKWVCMNCLHENMEDPLTPSKLRPFICKKCGVKKGVMRIYDNGPMRYDWKKDFCTTWLSKDGNYKLIADEEKLVLISGEQTVCEKAFYGEYGGRREGDGRPDSIRAEDGKGFGEILYFLFQGISTRSPVVGIIENGDETVEIEFGSGFEGMSINGWICQCGRYWNDGKYCRNCGLPKLMLVVSLGCVKCGWKPEDGNSIPKFCPECGNPFNKE